VQPADPPLESWTTLADRAEAADIAVALSSTTVPTLPSADWLDGGAFWSLTHQDRRGVETPWLWWDDLVGENPLSELGSAWIQ